MKEIILLLKLFIIAQLLVAQPELTVQQAQTARAIKFTGNGKHFIVAEEAKLVLYNANRKKFIKDLSVNKLDLIGLGEDYMLTSPLSSPLDSAVISIRNIATSKERATITIFNESFFTSGKGYYNEDFSKAIFPTIDINENYQTLKRKERALEKKREVNREKYGSGNLGSFYNEIGIVEDKIDSLFEIENLTLTVLSLPEKRQILTFNPEMEDIKYVYFHPNKKHLYVFGGDGFMEEERGLIHKIDLESGAIINKTKMPFAFEDMNLQNFSKNGKVVLFTNSDKSLIYELDKWNEPIVDNLPEVYISSYFADRQQFAFSYDGSYLAFTGDNGYIKLYDLLQKKLILEEQAFSSFHFHPERNLVLLSDYRNFKLMDLNKDLKNPVLENSKHQFLGSTPVFSPSGKEIVYFDESTVNFVDINLAALIPKKKPTLTDKVQRIWSVDFISGGKLLLTPTTGFPKVTSLKNITDWSDYLLTNSRSFPNIKREMNVILNSTKNEIKVTNLKNNQLIAQFESSNLDYVLSAKISPSKQFLAVKFWQSVENVEPARDYAYIKIFDLINKKLVLTIPSILAGLNPIITSNDCLLNFVPGQEQTKNYKNLPANFYENSNFEKIALQQIDITDGIVINQWEDFMQTNNNFELVQNGKAIIFNDYEKNKEEEDNDQPIIRLLHLDKASSKPKKLNFPVKHEGIYGIENILSTENEDEIFIVTKGSIGDITLDNVNYEFVVTLFNIQTSKIVERFVLNSSSIHPTSVKISPDNKYLVKPNADGSFMLIGLEKEKEVVSFFMTEQGGHLVVTPDKYYCGTKKAMDVVQFTINGKSYPARQFDLIYNRPDIVLGRFPQVNERLIKNYERAWQRRIKKFGFEPSKKVVNPHLPKINIKNELIPHTVTNPIFSIQIEAEDSKNVLERINIWINGVPVYDKKIGKEQQKYQRKIDLPLSTGNNKIQVSCLNSQGLESLIEEVEINYLGNKEKPILYLISIGVNGSGDDKLDYAEKDAKDFIQVFQKKKNIYSNVKSFSILGKDFSHKTLSKVKSLLKKTTIDDVVILFYAGHGVLDKKSNYFLVKERNGNQTTNKIPFNKVEKLLNDVPARQKLILLDACNSGEVDTFNLNQFKRNNTKLEKKNQTVEIKTRLLSKNQQVSFGKQPSFELMNELFVDLRRETGTTIIAAARGVELARESAQWNNGVFTHVILKGLLENKADLDQDGIVKVSELKKYVSKKVPELTNGSQQPTTRLENVANDFQIW